MGYLPKSKYKFKTAGLGELVYKANLLDFTGNYLELSNGTFREGKSIQSLGGELILKIPLKNDNTYKVIDHTFSNIDPSSRINGGKYSSLKKEIKKTQDKYEPIFFTKPNPTVKDYKKGNFKRYFCLRLNTLNNYIEISKDTYDSLKNEESKYDYKMHLPGFIIWNLSEGTSDLVNHKTLRKKSRQFPNIKILFPDLGEYAIPDILFAPKTQIDHIETQNDPTPPTSITPSLAVKPELEIIKKEAEAEVKNISRIRTKHTPKPRMVSRKKPKNTSFLSRGGGNNSSGGGGGY